MTDKAEALEEIVKLLGTPPISNLHRQVASMLTAQAAEIELLKRVAREVALQHHNWNQHNASLIGEQAAEIERMRAHIQAGRELVPRFQFLFPTSGSKESVGTMVDVLAHMRAQAFLGSAPASGH